MWFTDDQSILILLHDSMIDHGVSIGTPDGLHISMAWSAHDYIYHYT